jgi:hypothetical protein
VFPKKKLIEVDNGRWKMMEIREGVCWIWRERRKVKQWLKLLLHDQHEGKNWRGPYAAPVQIRSRVTSFYTIIYLFLLTNLTF